MASVQSPPDWRLPRGLRGLAGLRADGPSEARSAGRSRGGRRSGGAAAVAGDGAGLREGRRSGGAAAVAGDLAGYGQYWKANGGTDAKNRRPEGRRLFVRHGGLEPSTR